MNPIIDREIPMPQSAQGLKVCNGDCENPNKKSFIDRNEEVVVECQNCLGFVKFPKGTE